MSSSMMPEIRTARALLREVGKVVSEENIETVQHGSINATFRIRQGREPSLYLRLAPSDAEVDAGPSWMTSHGLRQEQTAIRMMEPLAHLLPRTVHLDWSREVIDRDWVLQTEVRGTPWTDVGDEMTDEQSIDIWRQLGRLLRTMHGIIGAEFGPPVEGFGHQSWSDLVRWDVTGLLVDAQRFGLDADPFRRLTELVNHSTRVLDEVTDPRLIHSDLHPHHVFVDRNAAGAWEITGLIDLEYARFADPGSESIFVTRELEGGDDDAFAAFCEGYDCYPPSRHDRFRLDIYALTTLGWIATDLHRIGEPDRIPEILEFMSDRLDDEDRLLL
jgi:Ser/Thr protein kinase RdoA (MazF antagonist)